MTDARVAVCDGDIWINDANRMELNCDIDELFARVMVRVWAPEWAVWICADSQSLRTAIIQPSDEPNVIGGDFIQVGEVRFSGMKCIATGTFGEMWEVFAAHVRMM